VKRVKPLDFIKKMPKLRQLTLQNTIIESNDLSPLIGREWDVLYFKDQPTYNHKFAEFGMVGKYHVSPNYKYTDYLKD
jgi:hypothetical protein